MNPTASLPRQTQSYLRDLFEARGLRPNGKLGQCFLVDLNLIDLIIREAELAPADLVLEVGVGTGSLTANLAQTAGAVLGVEIDRGMFELASDLNRLLPNVKLLHGDILESKHRLNPEVLRLLAEGIEKGGFQQVKLIANLPYVVATPTIANLLLTELPLTRLVVTIQWELAARLAAAPDTSDYGALSAFVQSLADVMILRKLPPSAFWPKPKVDSAIVKIEPRPEKRRAVGDIAGFHHFLHHLYLHRRKNLRGGLLSFQGDQISKAGLDEVLAKHGFDGRARAETLSPAEHLRLFHSLTAVG